MKAMKILIHICFLLIVVLVQGQTTLVDKENSTKFELVWNCEGCSMTWTGKSIDSLAEGKGLLTIAYMDTVIMQYKGMMSGGSFNGLGTYDDQMNHLNGFFVEGNYIGKDKSVFKKIEKIAVSDEDPDELYINDGNNNTDLFYYKMVPDGKPIGVLTIIPSGGESAEGMIQALSLHKEAIEKGLLVVIPSLNWGTNDRLADIAFLDTIFQQVVKEYDVSKDKFIFCGLSNGGMIALQYAIHAVKDANTFLKPKGIIGLDPPLDLAHLYAYCEREIQRNYSPGGVAEAKWIVNNSNSVYGGSPNEFPQKYIEASVFSYGAESGGNAKYLTDIPIRMHSDLNLDYLLNRKKRDLYDWNGTDIVAFVNQLKINGNRNAEVIITENKGIRLTGEKHPHSWSIMDTDEAMDWILELIQ